MEKLSLENAFQQLNYSASRIANAYHDAARRLGLSDSELDILYTLCTHAPSCPQSAIYKETGATRSTINSAIRKLEKAELLYLTPGQGRGTRVYLTERGRALTETTIRRLIALGIGADEVVTAEPVLAFDERRQEFHGRTAALGGGKPNQVGVERTDLPVAPACDLLLRDIGAL